MHNWQPRSPLRPASARRLGRALDFILRRPRLGGVVLGLAMLQAMRTAAQTSPATLPDLKLSSAGPVQTIAVQDDGKIIISGFFLSVNDLPRFGLARLNPNGTVDQTWNPHITVTDGILAIVPSGTNIYLGGSFYVTDEPGRYNLVRVSTLDGSTDKTWGPKDLIQPFTWINSIAINGDDVYVAGTFTNIGGLPRNHIAMLSASGSGAVDPTWGPDANDAVQQVLVNSNDVFVTGAFTSIGGQSRSNLAKLSATGTGRVDPFWDAKLMEPYGGDPPSIEVSGTNLYVSGIFTNIGSVPRQGLAKLSTLGSGLVDTNWNPAIPPFSPFSERGPLALVNGSLFVDDLRISTNGFVAAVAKLDANGVGARDTNWNASFDGGPWLLRATPSALLAAGFFHLCNHSVSLSLAKLDLVAGAQSPGFAAQVQSPGTVYALAQQSDGKVVIGGDFWFAGGLPRQNLARMNQDHTLDATWSPDADGAVTAIALSGTNLFVAGGFQTVGGLSRRGLAKLATVGSARADPAWDPVGTNSGGAFALAASGTNLFVGGTGYSNGIGGVIGRNALVKLSTSGSGSADASWQADAQNRNLRGGIGDGTVLCLALSGTNLYVGGGFNDLNGIGRTNIGKISSVSGALDTGWDASVPLYGTVRALAVAGTNLFVAGDFANLGGLPRNGLAKVSDLGNGVVDPNWDPVGSTPWALLDERFFQALAADNSGSNLYVGGLFAGGTNLFGLASISTTTGVIDALYYPPNPPDVYALLPAGNGLYAGGAGEIVGGNEPPTSGYAFAFLAVAAAPRLIQDSPTNLFTFPNAANGPEITHFQITGISGGTLYKADGVTPVNIGDFITVAEGKGGLNFVSGGTITAVSSLNDTPAGTGAAATTLTMVTNPAPVFKFSAPSYSVTEGVQNYIVIPVRKYGMGTGTVDYATSDLTAVGGIDYKIISDTLHYSSADTVKNIVIAIGYDFQPEPDRQFALTLTNPSPGAFIADPTAIVTIGEEATVGSLASLTTTLAPTSAPESSGVLTVSLQPPEANGRWRLAGELNWHNSSDSIYGLVTGNYQIEFFPVTNYFEPQPVTEPIRAGMTNAFSFTYYTNYLAPYRGTGNLSVSIEPADVATNADMTLRGQWTPTGEAPWFNSGELVGHLNPGSYPVEFKMVPGWLAPPPQIVEVGGGNGIYSVTARYLFGSTNSSQSPMVVPFGLATTNSPYFYNGQIQTSDGFGSGFVVKPRVVLTVAHVLFDDRLLSYTTEARWFLQRYRDQLEPVPQIPRGWYVFEGYAAQRQQDNSPGISTPASQNLDVAAMYFLEDAGRGGYGGYLSSDAPANEYLLSANAKFLAGYPLNGVADADQGKLFATTPANLNFTNLYNSVFMTTDIASFPGNSGGPLYVEYDIGQYLPAGIYLGGSGGTLVRAINSEVVDLINRADLSSNGGGNSTGGGVAIISSGFTATPAGKGLLIVSITPSSAIKGSGPGWRSSGVTPGTNYVTTPLTTNIVLGGGGYTIEFNPVAGLLEPSNTTVYVDVGQEVVVQGIYLGPVITSVLESSRGEFLLTVPTAAGLRYFVEYADSLRSTNWSTLSPTLGDGTVKTLAKQSVTNRQRFYRVRIE